MLLQGEHKIEKENSRNKIQVLILVGRHMALLCQFCKFYLIKGKFTQSQVLSYYRLAPYHFSSDMDVLLLLKMSSPTQSGITQSYGGM